MLCVADFAISFQVKTNKAYITEACVYRNWVYIWKKNTQCHSVIWWGLKIARKYWFWPDLHLNLSTSEAVSYVNIFGSLSPDLVIRVLLNFKDYSLVYCIQEGTQILNLFMWIIFCFFNQGSKWAHQTQTTIFTILKQF